MQEPTYKQAKTVTREKHLYGHIHMGVLEGREVVVDDNGQGSLDEEFTVDYLMARAWAVVCTPNGNHYYMPEDFNIAWIPIETGWSAYGKGHCLITPQTAGYTILKLQTGKAIQTWYAGYARNGQWEEPATMGKRFIWTDDRADNTGERDILPSPTPQPIPEDVTESDNGDGDDDDLLEGWTGDNTDIYHEDSRLDSND